MWKHFLIITAICGIFAGILFYADVYAQESRQDELPPDENPVIGVQQTSGIQPKPGTHPKSGVQPKPGTQSKPNAQPKIGMQTKPPAPRPEVKKPWLKQQDWFAGVQKRLEALSVLTTPDAGNDDFNKLLERAAELFDLAKSSKDNQFQHGRRLLAANAMMDAADRVLLAQKAESNSDENDFRRAGFVLRECYFRVRQADYFVRISGDKKSSQTARLASSLYQQGRSAYDAKEYGKAWLLGEASASVVFALECMAQAATPDPHIYK